jgi:NhaA family Na+:H+ antiporter
MAPIQRFIQDQAESGVLLLPAAVLALVLANSALAPLYEALLHVPIGISAGPYALNLTLEGWINDGLMAVFFLLVGLEIKRELLMGELADRRAALLPVLAACGGALLPALIYLALNPAGPGRAGWGIPMATDIAFTLGCLALLGDRVPFALKVFVTAVAIVDDLIAVLVIALFYSGALSWPALAVAALVLGLMFAANRLGVRHVWFYLGLGVVVWLAVFASGVHASIAGVLVALTVPARGRRAPAAFVAEAEDLLAAYERDEAAGSPARAEERDQAVVMALEEASDEAASPLQLLEHALERPVNMVIMPVFALANAGIPLSAGTLGGERTLVALGVFFGLVLGKPIGLVGASWLAVRFAGAQLPAGATWRQMVGAGILAGIGFTMAIFIADLAFEAEPELLNAAKLGILVASTVAGLAGLGWLRRVAAGED